MSKYKFKELWELTDEDHEDIYRYAMQRSDKIVQGALGQVDHAEEEQRDDAPDPG